MSLKIDKIFPQIRISLLKQLIKTDDRAALTGLWSILIYFKKWYEFWEKIPYGCFDMKLLSEGKKYHQLIKIGSRW